MKLRCKPGDRAFLVKCDVPEDIGKVCLVLRSTDQGFDGHEWLCRFEGRVVGYDVETGEQHRTRGCFVPDAWLRPIRDPGDDAQDETLTWLPVPTTEVVPA